MNNNSFDAERLAWRSDEPVEPPFSTSNDTLVARVLAEAARSTALAYDEVFALKRELALAHEPERARIAPEIQALQLQIVDLRVELAAAQAALSEAHLQQKFEEQRARADHFESYCNELLASTSWRITASLRAVKRLVGR